MNTNDYFISIKEVAKKAGYTERGIIDLCKKHGLGIRDYENEKSENDFKYKGMMYSEYSALFGDY